MKIEVNETLVSIKSLDVGEVFLHNDNYFMVTDAYTDKYMSQEARVYINLETGYHSKFRNCEVIPIHNIRLVIGEEK